MVISPQKRASLENRTSAVPATLLQSKWAAADQGAYPETGPEAYPEAYPEEMEGLEDSATTTSLGPISLSPAPRPSTPQY